MWGAPFVGFKQSSQAGLNSHPLPGGWGRRDSHRDHAAEMGRVRANGITRWSAELAHHPSLGREILGAMGLSAAR